VATVNLTQANFEETITSKDIVIVDFWAPWCKPCQSFAPVFESTSEKYPDIVFAKVNTDEERELGSHFQIRSIPTLMIFREKVIIYSQAGSLPASALQDVITKAQELDMETVRKEMTQQDKDKA